MIQDFIDQGGDPNLRVEMEVMMWVPRANLWSKAPLKPSLLLQTNADVAKMYLEEIVD